MLKKWNLIFSKIKPKGYKNFINAADRQNQHVGVYMEMKYKILIAVLAGCVLGVPANILLCHWARSKGISIKYMPVIVLIVIGMPIMAVPFLTDSNITWLNKLGILLVMLFAGVIN